MHEIKYVILLILLFSTFGCKQSNPKVKSDNNNELYELYIQDQMDRKSEDIDWSIVEPRDKIRQKRVLQMINSNKLITSDDYANAAMIFQHGSDSISSNLTIELMRKAIELNPARSRWLLAAAIDRDLMMRNEPQIYGTQFTKLDKDGPWILYDLDSTVITDNERMKHGVEPLKELKLKDLTQTIIKLEDLYADGKTIEEILIISENAFSLNHNIDLSEEGINVFASGLLGKNNLSDALKVYKANTEFYPASFKTLNAYGDCLLKSGDKKKALEVFKKSNVINSRNKYASIRIEEIKLLK